MAARLITAIFLAATGAAQQTDRATFQKVCGSCHDVSMVSDLKSTPEWDETVDSMVERGAKATAAERAAVMRYLKKNYTRININVAAADEIAEVLNISPTAAQALIAHRPYRSLDELRKADAVPADKLDALKDRIAFR
jgi:DNA uptake protein ComE-like DNA-binding protein